MGKQQGSVIDEITAHLSCLSPHIRDRLTARLLEKARAELIRYETFRMKYIQTFGYDPLDRSNDGGNARHDKA